MSPQVRRAAWQPLYARGQFREWGVNIMAKPSKADLSKAGRDLRNPHTPEKKESQAAKTLQKGKNK